MNVFCFIHSKRRQLQGIYGKHKVNFPPSLLLPPEQEKEIRLVKNLLTNVQTIIMLITMDIVKKITIIKTIVIIIIFIIDLGITISIPAE